MINKNNKIVNKIICNSKNVIRVLLKNNNIVFTNANIDINGPEEVNVGDTNNYYLTINNKKYSDNEIKLFTTESTNKIEIEYNTFKGKKEINAENIIFTLS